MRHSMKRLQSKDHGTGAYQIKKLLCSDVKIYILNNRYDRLAFSYPDQLYKKNSYYPSNCSQQPFCQAIKILF